ncbi:hypothetical protein GCM10023188_23660 [Pontibacter saemangeumensis]|uniref:Two component regulator propeller n=1 Tax=Pontibacter saemangeumensis TaxID=1084525 RepID=A0ABP8LRK6_9BACT
MKLSIVPLLLLLMLVLSSCEKDAVEKESVNYQLFNTSNSGLPTDFVNVLAIDNSSNIWIGTFDKGVVKYDGTHWTQYNTSNSPLPNDSVSSISVDNLNRIWIGTKRGVAMLDQQTWKTYNASNSGMKGTYVVSLTADNLNRVWVSATSKEMEKSGLYLFDGINWQFFNDENSIMPHYFITTMATDRNNVVWLGLGMFQGKGGLIKVQEEEWQLYDKSNSPIKYNLVDDISFSSTNKLILTSPAAMFFSKEDNLQGYMQTFDGNSSWTDISPANPKLTLSNRITASAYDKKDNIWIATSIDQSCPACNYTLYKYNGKKWTVLSSENGNFPRTFISDIKVDDSNTVWVAAGDVGLIKITQK